MILSKEELSARITNAMIMEEARILCRAHCRAAFCVDQNKCLNIWPGPGGTLSIYFKEAKERLLVKMMDAA